MPSRANADFPSFSEGLSLRHSGNRVRRFYLARFPFLFGRAFIEASPLAPTTGNPIHFPSFWVGLSLRRHAGLHVYFVAAGFPFLFGGAFIKALRRAHPCLRGKHLIFPYSFVGTFPDVSPLRSWTHHSPGTELFLFAAQEATRPKPRPQASPTSCDPPPP